jgi:hypothetical protein
MSILQSGLDEPNIHLDRIYYIPYSINCVSWQTIVRDEHIRMLTNEMQLVQEVNHTRKVLLHLVSFRHRFVKMRWKFAIYLSLAAAAAIINGSQRVEVYGIHKSTSVKHELTSILKGSLLSVIERILVANLIRLWLQCLAVLFELNLNFTKFYTTLTLTTSTTMLLPLDETIPTEVLLTSDAIHVIAAAVFLDECVTNRATFAKRHALGVFGIVKIVVHFELLVVVSDLGAFGWKVGSVVAAQAHFKPARATNCAVWVGVEVYLKNFTFNLLKIFRIDRYCWATSGSLIKQIYFI